MTLTAKEMDGQIIVEDLEGGIWWPNEAAAEEIAVAADSAAKAVEMAEQFPMTGTWKQ